jgi:hypothetical protein
MKIQATIAARMNHTADVMEGLWVLQERLQERAAREHIQTVQSRDEKLERRGERRHVPMIEHEIRAGLVYFA